MHVVFCIELVSHAFQDSLFTDRASNLTAETLKLLACFACSLLNDALCNFQLQIIKDLTGISFYNHFSNLYNNNSFVASNDRIM